MYLTIACFSSIVVIKGTDAWKTKKG